MKILGFTRKDALDLGLKRYDGKRCRKHDTTERFISSGGCCECVRTSARKAGKKWRATNASALSDYRKDYYAKNKSYFQKKYQEYVNRDPERVKNNHRSWIESNRKHKNVLTKTRSNRVKQQTPLWAEHNLITAVYTKCAELNELWGAHLEVDHIIPLRGEHVCGLHCWDNLQLLEEGINRSKSNKMEVNQ